MQINHVSRNSKFFYTGNLNVRDLHKFFYIILAVARCFAPGNNLSLVQLVQQVDNLVQRNNNCDNN